MRRPSAVLAAVAAAVVACAGLLVAPPAIAAAAPVIHVDRADPLMLDPLTVDVAALADDGTGAAFSGTVVLSVGRTSSSVAVAAPAGAVGVARIPTTAIPAGSATLTVRLKTAGRTVTRTLKDFAQVPEPMSISGFGCSAVPAGGGAIRWAVDRMNGDPIRTPNSRDLPLLPYVRSSAPRWSMTTAAGAPMRTSGTMTILTAGKVVAKQALAPAVRRLVFGTRWNGRAKGAFTPGVYTARLVLKDAAGRTITAQQQVQAVAKGVQPCGT